MLFNSFTFLAFMAVVLPLYYSLRMRGQNLLLLVAGFVFYGWWDWRFLLLLSFSAVIDYAMALHIVDHVVGDPRRKRWLVISMVVNLTILGFFKYFNFFVDSAATLLDTFGFEAHLPTLRIILPVGVSFYTFQSMSYTIDAYRGTIQPTRSLLHYLSFVAYFPQLVAGPIERAANMLPVFVTERKVDARCMSEGLLLILLGFFKKLVIADAVAGSVSAAFAEPNQLDGAQLLRAVYLFSLQIYGDFSGYSDIARGVSKLFGIDLMINFNQPYLSSSITEFWRRWHISLSTWLRDYLYIPLGGSRNGTVATYRNNFVTMLIGGLWHGASWNFVIWGGLHGLYLAVHKYWMGLRGIKEPPRPTAQRQWPLFLLKGLVTFHLVAFAWIFFRAADFETASTIVSRIFTAWNGLQPSLFLLPALYGALILFVDIPQYRSGSHTIFERWPAPARALFYASILALIFLLGGSGSATFIYFQF